MKDVFDTLSIRCSRLTTGMYSTSFSLGVRCLDPKLRDPIHALYGFVRFADEIVDTFHDFNRKDLLNRFRDDTYRAIDERISLNPILNSFQFVVNQYGIERSLIEQFLKSMEMDLYLTDHDPVSIHEYVLGSAEVVGLMCLKVFSAGDEALYDRLTPQAMKLGAAFQKINFLRDLNADYTDLGRNYFPGVDVRRFDEHSKRMVEEQIAADLREGCSGIRQLPRGVRLGVYVAYVYFSTLFRKIRNTPSELVLRERIRIPNPQKAGLLAYSYLKHQLNLI
ncbi:MAG TPA: phytoene/squalene synthase family protein [Ohtaekwangia sp.]|nr:phytoene/squalene synthase family protein [Ohtaekwangia sp.]